MNKLGVVTPTVRVAPISGELLTRNSPRYSGDRSKAVLAVTCALLRNEVDEDAIAQLLVDPRYTISAHCLDNGGIEFARRQVKRAKDHIERQNSLWETDKKDVIINNNQTNIRTALAELGAELSYDLFAVRMLLSYEKRELSALEDAHIKLETPNFPSNPAY